jgi:hypothetical protein
MMTVIMNKMEFKELLEEYTSNLEKDYESNQKGNSNHPVFSLIQNTYQLFRRNFYHLQKRLIRDSSPLLKK